MAIKKRAATFLGGGLGLSTVGKRVYAFSGEVTVATDDVVLLDFSTTRPIKFALEIGNTEESDVGGFIKIKINGVIIFHNFLYIRPDGPTGWDEIRFIIPPNSRMQLICKQTDTSTDIWTAMGYGKYINE